MWLAQHDFYCARKDTCIINVQVIDDHLDDPVVGHLSLWLDDLLDGNETGVEWWPMSGCSTGEVMIRAVWRPVDLSNY
jgi:Ca2+-dependent lipid-binding protein